jgi:hypothetical protein
MSNSTTAGTASQPVAVNVIVEGAPTPASTRMEPRVPLGVAILCVALALYGIASIVLAVLVYDHTSIGWLQKSVEAVPTFRGFTGTEATILGLVVGLVAIGTAIGLWRLSLVALVIALLALAAEAALYAIGNNYWSPEFIASVILLVYLLAVSGHFR